MAAVLVLVCEETGGADKANLEVLTAAGSVAASLGGEVCVAIAGCEPESRAGELAAHGVQRVVYAPLPADIRCEPDAWLEAFEAVCRAERPAVVLMAGNPVGREVAPRLAYRLEAGLVTDCVGLSVGPDRTLIARKPVYGGKALADFRYRTPVQMATVRPRSYEAPRPGSGPAAPVSRFEVALDGTRRVHLRTQEYKQASGVSLEKARVVVSGGRGLGGPEGFRVLEQLAELLDAGVGASRVAVDNGWALPEQQIGLTGKTVAPQFYFAIGISGAAQHLAGIASAKTIIAINTDPEAPIFRKARFGLVGDYRQVVPALIAALQGAKA